MDIRRVPIVLTRSRLVLGPLVLVLAVLRVSGIVMGTVLVAALLTDIFDGVIARRLKIVTPELRVADSKADGVYTLCLISSVCIRRWDSVAASWIGVAIVALLELANTVIDHTKYGRASSHHAYSAKLWAASGCVMAVAILVFNRPQPYLKLAIALGILNNIEGLAMRAIMPSWAHDVSGIPAALKVRRAQLDSAES